MYMYTQLLFSYRCANMYIRDLDPIKKFLVGDIDDPSWLQSVHTFISSQSDFLCLCLDKRLVLLQAKYLNNNKVFLTSAQVSARICIIKRFLQKYK